MQDNKFIENCWLGVILSYIYGMVKCLCWHFPSRCTLYIQRWLFVLKFHGEVAVSARCICAKKML